MDKAKVKQVCDHEWIVTVDEDNYPEDVMCSKCKEVIIMVVTTGKDE